MKKKIVKWFYKTLYRNARSRCYSHNKNIWNYFKLDKRTSDVLFRDINLKSYNFKPGCVKEKPLTLVFTGPSVNSISRDYFNHNEYDLFGTNGAISGFHGFSYYCMIDSGFVDNRRDLVMEIISSSALVLFCSPSVMSKILDIFDVSEVKCCLKVLDIVSDGICYPLLKKQFYVNESTDPVFFNKEGSVGFSSDIDFCVFDYNTVAYVALQIAYFLGYKKIYLAGLDMNNFDKPRFYETLSNKQPTALESHFDEIVSCFEYASSVAVDEKISVINLSLNSAIKSFPFII